MSNLPVVVDDEYGYAVVERASGEMVALSEAGDHDIAAAAAQLAEIDRSLLEIRRAVASEMRVRHGVGTATAGGYGFTVAESQSWSLSRTSAALVSLREEEAISAGDLKRCLPSKPKPDPRQLKALIGRLTVSNPKAAKRLAEACSVSPPSLRDIKALAVDEAA